MKPFFIVSYPRSMTAWLAAFLTHGQVSCGHELSAGDPTAAAIMEKLRGRGTRFAGSADTYQAKLLPELLRLAPDAPVVVIHRAEKEVCDSLDRCGVGFGAESCNILRASLRWAGLLPQAMNVNFAALTQEAAARAILAHVAPGEPFDAERWALLRDFNIQISPARWARLHALVREKGGYVLA